MILLLQIITTVKYQSLLNCSNFCYLYILLHMHYSFKQSANLFKKTLPNYLNDCTFQTAPFHWTCQKCVTWLVFVNLTGTKWELIYIFIYIYVHKNKAGFFSYFYQSFYLSQIEFQFSPHICYLLFVFISNSSLKSKILKFVLHIIDLVFQNINSSSLPHLQTYIPLSHF